MKTKNTLLEIFISFSLYWAFVAPLYFFPQLKSGPITYYIFLPAGLKLLTILIFRWRGLVGVALGTFTRLMFTDPTQSMISWFLVAFSANLAIYVVVECGLKLFKVDRDLSNINYYQVVVLATLASILNGSVFAFAVSSLTTSQMSGGLFHSSFVTIMGNFAGNALFVCTALFILQHRIKIINFVSRLKAGIK